MTAQPPAQHRCNMSQIRYQCMYVVLWWHNESAIKYNIYMYVHISKKIEINSQWTNQELVAFLGRDNYLYFAFCGHSVLKF